MSKSKSRACRHGPVAIRMSAKMAPGSSKSVKSVKKTNAAGAITTIGAMVGIASAGAEPALAKVTTKDVEDAAVNLIESTANVVTKTTDTVTGVAGDLTEAAKVVAKASEPAVSAATPIVKAGVGVAVEKGTPIVGQLFSTLKDAVNQGVDSETLSQASSAIKKAADVTGKAVDVGLPVATEATKTTVDFVTTTDPVVLAAGAAAAFVSYYALPPLAGVLADISRGYAGNISAPDLLDTLINKRCTLVDIRSDQSRVSAGEPQLPSQARNKFVHWPVVKITRKERGQVKGADAIESQVTAIQIAALKKLPGKGSPVVIMDENGSGQAKDIAKRVSSMGYSKVYVLNGGFSAWKSASLGVQEVSRVFTEVVTPPELGSGSTIRGFLN